MHMFTVGSHGHGDSSSADPTIFFLIKYGESTVRPYRLALVSIRLLSPSLQEGGDGGIFQKRNDRPLAFVCRGVFLRRHHLHLACAICKPHMATLLYLVMSDQKCRKTNRHSFSQPTFSFIFYDDIFPSLP